MRFVSAIVNFETVEESESDNKNCFVDVPIALENTVYVTTFLDWC